MRIGSCCHSACAGCDPCRHAGFAAAHACWLPQLDAMLKPAKPGDLPPVRIMVLDNRGVGRSSAPAKLRAYSTSIMADDVLAVMVRPRAASSPIIEPLCSSGVVSCSSC